MNACRHQYKLSVVAELATCQTCGKVIARRKNAADRLRDAHQRDGERQKVEGK